MGPTAINGLLSSARSLARNFYFLAEAAATELAREAGLPYLENRTFVLWKEDVDQLLIIEVVPEHISAERRYV